MQEGALPRLVYITAYSSISFFLPFPHPPPFIYSTTPVPLLLLFSLSLWLSLFLCLSLLESRSSPFHPLIVLFHAPFLSVIFFFLFAFPPPFSTGRTVFPIYPIGKKKKKENRGDVRELLAGGCIDETTTLAASRRHLKCSCVNRSATFAKGRKILRCASASLSIAENSSSNSSLLPLKSQDKTA